MNNNIFIPFYKLCFSKAGPTEGHEISKGVKDFEKAFS